MKLGRGLARSLYVVRSCPQQSAGMDHTCAVCMNERTSAFIRDGRTPWSPLPLGMVAVPMLSPLTMNAPST